YPGGAGTVPTIQLFTDYPTRLMRYLEFMKKVVPIHDDLFDFFYEAIPGYEEVGRRRVLLGCWGSLQDPAVCDFKYENMATWGDAAFVISGVVVDGKLVTHNLVDINLCTGLLPVAAPRGVPRPGAQPGTDLLPGLHSRPGAVLRRGSPEGAPRRSHPDLDAVQGSRRGDLLRVHRGGPRRSLPPHGHPWRQD